MYSIKDIYPLLEGQDFRVIGASDSASFSEAKTTADAGAHSLVWISPTNRQKSSLLKKTAAGTIICEPNLDFPADLLEKKCFILTKNPKLIFSLIVNGLLTKAPDWGIHPSAVVHPQAELAENVYIGPLAYVGKCKIGNYSRVWGHSYIHDDVEIGQHVDIRVGCIIGDEGSGYAKNEQGEWTKFPHIGRTIIEDYVDVGTNSYVNRGALGDTIIRRGAKIGNAVCIGHNALIDENAMIIANTVVSGSTHVGKNAYVAPSSVIRNQLKIGANATVGMGAVVLKDVDEGTTVIGNPAVTLKEYKAWAKLKARLFKEKK